MKLIHLTLLLIVVTFATGCPKTQTPMPGPLRDQLIKNRIAKLTDLADKYDSAVDAGGEVNLGKAKIYRNELIYQVLQLVDDNYNQFENDLFVGRATTNVAGDLTELGIAAATGITNGERVKTILAIALTAFKGGRKSIDMNFFRERTTEVIALKMRASRARVLQTIHQGIGLEVGQYPLGAGLDDLINYLHAGSINAAFLELAQDTGADAKAARGEASELKIHPYLTKGQRAALRSISDAREKIFLNLSSSSAEATRKETEARLRTVLPKLGYTTEEVKAAKTTTALKKMLQDKIMEADKKRDGDMLTTIQTELNALLDGLP
ncbi:MAG TPA: hypothetical protein DHU55_05985 [Blastocatellia bacterium]|nr:hypothetical protein [Blastocatellia bacterium]HCX29310.1 hypothetical protein [Blastocatellia bacterium]